MKKEIIISFILLFFLSCDNKFPEYIKKEEDVYMKLLSFNENVKEIKVSDFGVLSIEIYENNKVIYRHHKEEPVSIEKSKFHFLIKHLDIGDSSSFMVSTKMLEAIFNPLKIEVSGSEYVEVIVTLYDVVPKFDIDEEMTEQILLKKYANNNNTEFFEGIYIERVNQGKGEVIKKGDNITIAYKGTFINGLEFDNVSDKTAFTFRYGVEGQIIKGLERAIKLMRKGEKSKIIIPSPLAFGEEGSTTLIVPPYTTVVYELEIIEVIINNNKE